MAVILATLGVLWLPGAVLRRLLHLHHHDLAARLGHELALGLAFWPLLFLLTSSAGVAWSPVSARLVLAVAAIGLLGSMVRGCAAGRRWPRPGVVGVAVLALVVWTRVAHVRDVVWPLWVDSVHHTMIVRLIVEQGMLPKSYAPFIPESTFYYHWGFHAVIAFVAWIAGAAGPTELPRVLLVAGQVLNASMFFAVYAGATALWRSRRAAVLAAALATVVSFFPAYYVSWGRYTQLAGLLILPPLGASVWMLGRHPSRGRAVAVAILGGGLLLIHVRVAVVFAILAAILTVVLLVQKRWGGVAWCVAAGAAAIMLASPWLVRLARVPEVSTILRPNDAVRWETSNAAPDDLVWAPNNVPLFILGTGGLFSLLPVRHVVRGWRVVGIALWLALVLLLQRHPKTRGQGLARLSVLAAWVAVTALLINAPRLPRIVPNSAAIVMLFLPLSLAGAHVVRWAIDAALPWRRRGMTMALVTVVVAVAGASTMRRIVNPVTLLVTPADVDALRWIRVHTPVGARFAVGVQPWIGDSFMGIDGGYWIPIVSDRSSILPPGLYPWAMPAARVDRITSGLVRWREAEASGNLAAIGDLRRDGVTHVYFGARNDTPLRRAMPLANAARVYDAGGVEIYALR